jgi:predicted PurR-regulated permease PerM
LLGRITALLWVVVIALAVTFFTLPAPCASRSCLRFPSDSHRRAAEPITKKIQRVQENAGKLNPTPASKKVPEVRISETPSWPAYLARGVGSVSGAIVIAGVIPFLIFFMLVRKDHIYCWLSTTSGRMTDISEFVRRLDRMVRGFAGGNLIVGFDFGNLCCCSADGDWDARGVRPRNR